MIETLKEWINIFISFYCDNIQYTLPSTLAFIGDYFFKWHTIIIDFLKNRLLKRDSKKSNYTLYKEGLNRQRQMILQESLYIWDRHEYDTTKEIYRNCYVKKIPIVILGNEKKKKFFVRKNKGVAILGKAGVGKSTYLRYLFLQHTNFFYSVINAFLNRRYYFYKISDLISNSSILQYLENDKKNSRSKFIFLDGLDEIEDSQYKKIMEIIEIIFNYNYTIMISCRKDVYEKIKYTAPQIFNLVRYHIEIGEWTPMQSNEYILKYSKFHPNSDILNLIRPYQENDEFAIFFKTPLEISLLVYILEQMKHGRNEEISANKFDLYEKFLRIWTEREMIRKGDNQIDNEFNVDNILDFWSTIAFYLIRKSNTKLLYTSSREMKAYFQKNIKLKKYLDGIVKSEYINGRKCIIGFIHEQIMEFLVAYYFCYHIFMCDEKCIDAVLWEYKYSVTSFIQEKFRMLNYEDLKEVFINLISILLHTDLYKRKFALSKYKRTLCLNLRKQISNLSKEQTRIMKNQIIYFISRIPNINNRFFVLGNQIIQEVYKTERDQYNKRSAAIGATILGNSEIELTYANELLHDEESNLRDRSFTMVYYQDIIGEDPFTYTDDGVSKWDNSRRSRLERLKDTSEKSVRLRTFDLITIFNFTRSRVNSFIPTQEEFDIIANCEVNISSYPDEKKELLNSVKAELIQLWGDLMQ